MSDRTWVEMCGEIDAWMNGITRRLNILWQAHKQAQLECGMEETVFSANTELAQALADLHVENNALSADNAALKEANGVAAKALDIVKGRELALLCVDKELQAALCKVVRIEDENKGLRETINMYVADLASLRAKNEAAIDHCNAEMCDYNQTSLREVIRILKGADDA